MDNPRPGGNRGGGQQPEGSPCSAPPWEFTRGSLLVPLVLGPPGLLARPAQPALMAQRVLMAIAVNARRRG